VKIVAIFAKACFGHPSPSKQQKLNATANAFGAPIRPRHHVKGQLSEDNIPAYKQFMALAG
jgi:hypothetical protein